MSVKTGGEKRGFFGRWLMRIQAVRGILQLLGIMVTAASTLTSALVAIGYSEYAPYMIVGGILFTPAFAWVYVEWGLFSRKNREQADRGQNWLGPQKVMGQMIFASTIGAAVKALNEDGDPSEAAMESCLEQMSQLRDGVPMEEVLNK